MKVKSLFIVLAGATLLSGCGVVFDDYDVLKPNKSKKHQAWQAEADELETVDFLAEKKKQLRRLGNSREFVQGYADGCASGMHAVGEKNYRARKAGLCTLPADKPRRIFFHNKGDSLNPTK